MKKIERLELSTVTVKSLHQHPLNPNQGDVGAIIESLEAHGYYRPVIVQKSTRNIIAGNHTVQACAIEGIDEIDVILLDVDDDQALRILLTDNQTAAKAKNNPEILTDILINLFDSDFGLEGTGFDGDDLDELVNEFKPEPEATVKETKTDQLMEPPVNPITRPGDIWLLGPHRLICADATDPTSFERVLDGAVIDLVVTSPPRARRNESGASQPATLPDDYVSWWEPVQRAIKSNLSADGSMFVNLKPESEGLDMDTYVMELVVAHAKQWGWHLAEELCWERVGYRDNSPGRFKNQFEPIYQFVLGEWKFNPEAVMVQRKPSKNAAPWDEPSKDYPGNRLPTFATATTNHPQALPVLLAEWLIKAYSHLHNTVLDPFMGSGPTLVAAHSQGRIAYGIEINPAYCDVICNRFQGMTEITPILEATGEEVSFID